MDQTGILLFLAGFLWLAGLTVYLVLTVSQYRKVVKDSRGNGLAETMQSFTNRLDRLEKHQLEVLEKIAGIHNDSKSYTQHVHVLRFNPFKDTGGEQSFIFTVLDAKGSGVLLTSLHNRNLTRWYAKNILEGKGIDHELSAEEKNAIELALKKKKQYEKQ